MRVILALLVAAAALAAPAHGKRSERRGPRAEGRAPRAEGRAPPTIGPPVDGGESAGTAAACSVLHRAAAAALGGRGGLTLRLFRLFIRRCAVRQAQR